MTLLVVSGPPGAGKSTVARALAARFDPSVLVEGDAFFAFVATGAVPPWLPESDAQNAVVARAASAAAGRYVEGGYTAVYDGVVGSWSIDAFATGTGLAELHYAVLLPSAERCAHRVLTRADHGFRDEAAARHMHAQFARARIDPRHVLVDPPDEVGAVVEEILRRLAAGLLAHPCR